MPLPLVAGALAAAAAVGLAWIGSTILREGGKKVEEIMTTPEQKKYLSEEKKVTAYNQQVEPASQSTGATPAPTTQAKTAGGSFSSGGGPFSSVSGSFSSAGGGGGPVVTTTKPVQEAISTAVEKEQQMLEQTPEIPVISDVSKMVGFGKATTGGFGSAIGLGYLPEVVRTPLGDVYTKDVGGGKFERQQREVYNQLIERGYSPQEAHVRVRSVGSYGSIGYLSESASNVFPEIAGGLAFKSGVRAVSGVGNKLINKAPEYAKPILRKARDVGAGSVYGSAGESFAQSGSEWIKEGARPEQIPYYAYQGAYGAVVGAPLTATIEGVRVGGASIKKPKVVGGFVERVGHGAGLLVDSSEVLEEAVSRVRRPSVFSVGGKSFGSSTSALYSNAPSASVKSESVPSTSSYASVSVKGQDKTPTISEKAKQREPFPVRQREIAGGKTIVPTESVPTQDQQTQTETQQEQQASVSVNAFSNVQGRAWLPNRRNTGFPFLLFPPIAYGFSRGMERRRYYNELNAFGRVVTGFAGLGVLQRKSRGVNRGKRKSVTRKRKG